MDTNNSLLKSIQTVVNESVNNAPYDKTRNALILDNNENGYYKIRLDGIEYSHIKAYGGVDNLAANTMVKVVIPGNQASRMFILPANGGGGGAVWGNITGTLSDQTDLNTALNGKISGVKIIDTELIKDANGKVTVPLADSTQSGVVKSGANGFEVDSSTYVPYSTEYTLAQYGTQNNNIFISKGTLENIKTDMFNRARLGNVKTTLDATAISNTDYFLGTQTSVNIILPSTPNVGDMINVVFYSGDTAATLTITGETLGAIPTPLANNRLELNMLYDGRYWNIYNRTVKVSRLPRGYQEVEWIGSSGTQYIDTGIVLNYGDRVEVDYMITSKAAYKSIFGAYEGSKKAYFGMDTSTNYYLRLGVGATVKASTTKADTNKHTAIATFTSGASILNIDGTNILTNTATGDLSSYSCFLFADSNAGTLDAPISANIYSFKVYRNDLLIANFVPCYDSNNIIGMYDLITNTFKTNLGTGTFTKGSDV